MPLCNRQMVVGSKPQGRKNLPSTLIVLNVLSVGPTTDPNYVAMT